MLAPVKVPSLDPGEATHLKTFCNCRGSAVTLALPSRERSEIRTINPAGTD